MLQNNYSYLWKQYITILPVLFNFLMIWCNHLPKRIRYGVALTLVVASSGMYWYTELSDFSISWQYTLQWEYLLNYDSPTHTWKVLWTLSWWKDSLWNFTFSLDGIWNFGADKFSFGPHMMNSLEDSSYLYYGPVKYIARYQTWLSQALHQYFRLGDSYEQKRYQYENTWEQISLEKLIEKMEWYWFTTTHTSKTGKFSVKWTVSAYKSLPVEWDEQTLYWEISYIIKSGSRPIKKPQQYLDGDIFTEAFLWSGYWNIFTQ